MTSHSNMSDVQLMLVASHSNLSDVQLFLSFDFHRFELYWGLPLQHFCPVNERLDLKICENQTQFLSEDVFKGQINGNNWKGFD